MPRMDDEHASPPAAFRLTDRARAAGCAGKLGPADLSRVLATLPVATHPDLLVGTATADDAGVFRLGPDLALVQTVDFFSPIVDDPFQFGAVAAANAISDVYAMGGEPRTALNVVCFPQRDVPLEVLGEILRGGIAKADEAGVVVLGGHTFNDEEIKFGMAVTGVVHPDRIWRNVGARPGDALVLTKALGTGIVTTARKRGAGTPEEEAAAVASMLALNAAATRVLRGFTVHACTDVTGFSLLGHAFEMAHGSGVRLVVEAGCFPVLPGARALALGGQLTGGCRRNREWLGERVEIAPSVPSDLVEIGFDPQTSGGLLAAVPHADADTAVAALQEGGVTAAAIIGVVQERQDGPWVLLG
jgi:selenide, water dikinase